MKGVLKISVMNGPDKFYVQTEKGQYDIAKEGCRKIITKYLHKEVTGNIIDNIFYLDSKYCLNG